MIDDIEYGRSKILNGDVGPVATWSFSRLVGNGCGVIARNRKEGTRGGREMGKHMESNEDMR
jgi:hypothetical protein